MIIHWDISAVFRATHERHRAALQAMDNASMSRGFPLIERDAVRSELHERAEFDMAAAARFEASLRTTPPVPATPLHKSVDTLRRSVEAMNRTVRRLTAKAAGERAADAIRDNFERLKAELRVLEWQQRSSR